MSPRNRGLSIAGWWLTALGAALLGFWADALIYRQVSAWLATRAFDKAREEIRHEKPRPELKMETDGQVDFSLWSKFRVQAYSESLRTVTGQPVAVLYIEKLNLRVPIFPGTDDWTLNRGLGWIEGTAQPGEPGNIGIAGHRDGFFRGLQNTENGDVVQLTTLTRTDTYAVDEVEIVDPSNVSALEPRAAASLTLVTCYPFYFVGKAPKRFIVHAALRPQEQTRRIWN